jgi:hypothetical protein
MKATDKLHSIGQSIWLNNITRGILNDGTLSRHIDDLSVTGLTSNPTIFDHAIANSEFYDDAIQQKSAEGKIGGSSPDPPPCYGVVGGRGRWRGGSIVIASAFTAPGRTSVCRTSPPRSPV